MKKKIALCLLVGQLLNWFVPLTDLGTIVYAQESEHSETKTKDSEQVIDNDNFINESNFNENTVENESVEYVENEVLENIESKEFKRNTDPSGITFESTVVADWKIEQDVKILSIKVPAPTLGTAIYIGENEFTNKGTEIGLSISTGSMRSSGNYSREIFSNEGVELPGESQSYRGYGIVAGHFTDITITITYKISSSMEYRNFIDGEYLSLPIPDIFTMANQESVSAKSGPKLKIGDITELFIDSYGNELEESISSQGLPGTDYKLAPKSINGYEFVGMSIGTDNQIITDLESIPFTTSKQMINYNYTKINTLTAEIVSQEIVLGGEFLEKNLQDSVENVRYNGDLLTNDAYTVELVSSPQNGLIGQSLAEIKVIHTETGLELRKEIPVSVLWGHSIYSKESASNGSTAAISLINTSSGPELVATEGFGSIGTIHLSSRPHYQIFRDIYGEQVANLPLGSVGQARRDVVTNWNNTLSNTNVLYGDVLRLAVNRYAVSTENYNGANTWVTRNEESILETVGFPEALYMITEQGYHLLRVNQLRTQSLTFKSKPDLIKELEERKSEFFLFHDEFEAEEIKEITFEILNHEEIDSLGNKQAQIRATQKIGEFTFSYDYNVNFNIESGELLINQVPDFHFGEIAKSSREIRTYVKGNEIPRMIIQDYSALTGWSLNVSATSFSNKKGETIPGATISLKDIKLVSTSHKWIHTPEELELNEAGRSLAVMTNPQHVNGLEQGETVIEMGEEKNGELTGVELTIPAHSSIDSDDYSATITWELVTDPTM